MVNGRVFFSFFFNDTATTEIYTLSLHDALPILNLPKETKDLYAENYKTLMKEKRWYKQMERYTMFFDWKNQHCENDCTTQSNLQIRYNLYKNSNDIFYRNRTNNPKFHMELQKTQNTIAILRKNN